MISFRLTVSGDSLVGFSVSGHGTADEDDDLGRIICSAVSSAVYLTVNTLTEIVGAEVDVTDDGDCFSVLLKSAIPESQVTLEGLKLHITTLAEDYNEKIEIISEV